MEMFLKTLLSSESRGEIVIVDDNARSIGPLHDHTKPHNPCPNSSRKCQSVCINSLGNHAKESNSKRRINFCQYTKPVDHPRDEETTENSAQSPTFLGEVKNGNKETAAWLPPRAAKKPQQRQEEDLQHIQTRWNPMSSQQRKINFTVSLSTEDTLLALHDLERGQRRYHDDDEAAPRNGCAAGLLDQKISKPTALISTQDNTNPSARKDCTLCSITKATTISRSGGDIDRQNDSSRSSLSPPRIPIRSASFNSDALPASKGHHSRTNIDAKGFPVRQSSIINHNPAFSVEKIMENDETKKSKDFPYPPADKASPAAVYRKESSMVFKNSQQSISTENSCKGHSQIRTLKPTSTSSTALPWRSFDDRRRDTIGDLRFQVGHEGRNQFTAPSGRAQRISFILKSASELFDD